jgi:hypothetical protein
LASVELTRGRRLDRFFAANAALPWGWGTVDCAMVLADWAIASGHPDPFIDYRGAYRTEEGWKAIVTPRGGMLPLVSEVLSRTQIAPVAVAVRGVIAVIGSPSHPLRQWGAIHDGARWQVRLEQGFTAVTARPLSLWSV